MDGVEILATQEIAVEFAFNWVALLVCFGIVFTVFVLFGTFMSTRYDDWKQLVIGIIVGTIMGGLFGTILGFGLEFPTKFENQYKVIISDEVSMNDFLDKYEIVDEDGKIYVVRERD